MRHRNIHVRLMCGAAMALALPMAAAAEVVAFDIAPQPLTEALKEFGVQSRSTIVAKPEVVQAKASLGVARSAEPDEALSMLLEGTGLTWRREGGTFMIVQAGEGGSSPQAASAGDVDALIVTAQKKEENIQDVPIAISAFSAKMLEAQKIEGGFDLLKAIPNVTFSKNNFSGYNFSIRGIGTKAISITTDPGVAVEFNDTPLIRNRLFEQEYFDVERVEVLRGPQGTLHGRNATAGVINVISRTPDLGSFGGSIKGEVGNYHAKRISGAVNIPLAEDVLGVRLAGALTSRDGYDFNATTGNAINGRDLWSARLTLGYEPNERMRADLIWERFEEDDDRARTGKQLCHHDAGPETVAGHTNLSPLARASLSQGCLPGGLYADAAFGTPNGLSMPFMLVASDATITGIGSTAPVGSLADRMAFVVSPILQVDPYGGMMQSRDLRTINSIKDPVYRAKTDVLQANLRFDLTDALTLTSQTAYAKDSIFSIQDYNRFNTVPVFRDSSGLFDLITDDPSEFRSLTAGGVYCDPQIGCSNTIAGFDMSRAESEQYSQEIRVASSFDGPVNFSLGANYTDYRTVEDYFVFFNLITLLSQLPNSNNPIEIWNDSADYTQCRAGRSYPDLQSMENPVQPGCIYVDPNPLESINGDGHNYFRSKNPYRLKSWAAFGELYWDATPELKITAGLRYTDDRKIFTPVPSQLLLSSRAFTAGLVDRGYPAEPDIVQTWGEVSGRLGFDWRPDLAFTDDTMIYAFYSRGYKGGGANPPGIGFNPEPIFTGSPVAQTLPYPELFDPEFVNAFEIGAKNTLLGGALVLNGNAFYYDYSNYQVSQIKDRTAVNENFDATVWGLELEAVFSPSRDLRFNATLGYQDTKIADGETSLDLMNRTQGDPDYVVTKPFVQSPSNCVAPKAVVDFLIDTYRSGTSPIGALDDGGGLIMLCPGTWMSEALGPMIFDFAGVDRDAWLAETNGGAGFYDDLSGNELPNAPHWTASAGAQYGFDFRDGWRATVRGDAYWQSQSWHRVYNSDPYDKLRGWYNLNLSLWLENDDGLKIELYAKNILDKTPITDAFLNSDDTALTTNVFVLDPRLIGLSVRKAF